VSTLLAISRERSLVAKNLAVLADELSLMVLPHPSVLK
jgi:hypothetical protein